jgi:hypothetical protein
LAALAAGLAVLAGIVAHFTPVPLWPPSAFLSFYGSSYQGGFNLSTVPAALFGTLFDRFSGAVYFPALLLVFGGAWLLRRRSRLLAFTLAAR